MTCATWPVATPSALPSWCGRTLPAVHDSTSNHRRRSTTMNMNKSVLPSAKPRANGNARAASSALRVLLSGLQAMRDGDFSVRLPGDWTELEGKVADAFNEIVAA